MASVKIEISLHQEILQNIASINIRIGNILQIHVLSSSNRFDCHGTFIPKLSPAPFRNYLVDCKSHRAESHHPQKCKTHRERKILPVRKLVRHSPTLKQFQIQTLRGQTKQLPAQMTFFGINFFGMTTCHT